MSDLAVAQAFVNERRQWTDSMVRYCIDKADTRDKAVDLLATQIADYVREIVNHAYYAIPWIVRAALPLPGGQWEADPDLDYRNIADLLMMPYWGFGDPKPTSSKNRRPSNGGSASKAGKAPAKKKTPARASARRY